MERPVFPKRAVVTGGMPYGNKTLHFGHVGGMYVHADVYARFLRDRIGKDNVVFVSGTDCYGSPIAEGYRKKVEAEGYKGTIEDYVRKNHEAQEKTLKEQHELLNKLEAVMSEQQQKLDDIIGIRAELVQELNKEFGDSLLKVSVDEKTGGIAFDASILFDYNKAVLKESGKEFLSDFLPRYVEVLLRPKYRDNISEIIIEGHTDTEGTYIFNLQLSQKRAMAVAEYCLSDKSDVLTDDQLEEMRKLVSATGRSYSNPIYDENGEVDMEGSRRVELLFRLKDEEMVREMMEILSEEAKDE